MREIVTIKLFERSNIFYEREIYFCDGDKLYVIERFKVALCPKSMNRGKCSPIAVLINNIQSNLSRL